MFSFRSTSTNSSTPQGFFDRQQLSDARLLERVIGLLEIIDVDIAGVVPQRSVEKGRLEKLQLHAVADHEQE